MAEKDPAHIVILAEMEYNDTRVKRSKIRCKLACERIFDFGTHQKHEEVAIFRRKMSEFRMFLGFREHKVRRNPVS